MKINGEVPGVYVDTFVFNRPASKNIVLKIGATVDADDFDKFWPEPKMPTVHSPELGTIPNPNDAVYQSQVQMRNEGYVHYLVINGLKHTDGLVWDKVKPDVYTTWASWRDEFKEAGFSTVEIGKIFQYVIQVNNLDEEMLKKARADFLTSADLDQKE